MQVIREQPSVITLIKRVMRQFPEFGCDNSFPIYIHKKGELFFGLLSRGVASIYDPRENGRIEFNCYNEKDLTILKPLFSAIADELKMSPIVIIAAPKE